MFKLIILILLLYFLSISCSESSVEPFAEIDESLVGSWYHTTVNKSNEGPSEFIYGINIHSNGVITRQAIQTSTGRLADLKQMGKILSTSNNKMKLQILSSDPGGGPVEYLSEISYKIVDTILTFIDSKDENINNPFLETYYKVTPYGKKLTKPILSYFKLSWNMSDGSKYYITNKPISPTPSSYAFKKNNSLIIIANSDYLFYKLEVINYSGVGIYDSNNVKVIFEILEGDIYERFTSERDSIIVTLNIDYGDSKKVMGKLKLNIKNQDREFDFTDGEFTIPIY